MKSDLEAQIQLLSHNSVVTTSVIKSNVKCAFRAVGNAFNVSVVVAHSIILKITNTGSNYRLFGAVACGVLFPNGLIFTVTMKMCRLVNYL